MKSVFDFDKNLTGYSMEPHDVLWRNAKDPVFGVYGTDAAAETGFYRLTKAERDYIRPINDGEAWLGEQSSGIQIRFETNSAQIFVRVKLRSKFDMTNMTQIGQCGLDLYVWDERAGGYGMIEVARYPFDAAEYELSLGRFDRHPRKPRKYILNLPLYMAVDGMEIGLDRDAWVKPNPFAASTRIGIYGTSIVHGCSASRPGLSPTNVLSRRLDEEVLNFGFSGCAMMEKEMGEILGKRKLDLLIADTEPNAGCDESLRNNAEAFLNAFFENSPNVPVVLFSRILFSLDLYDDYRVEMADYYRGFLKELAGKFRRRGKKVLFEDGSKIFKGNFTEFTTDGIHPDDVGMLALTNAYERAIRRARK